MALGRLKRGGEPRLPLDVRSLGIPENKPTDREKFKLPEFECLLKRLDDQFLLDKYICAGQLKCLFPEREEEIKKRLPDKSQVQAHLEKVLVGALFTRLNYISRCLLADANLDVTQLIPFTAEEVYKKIIESSSKGDIALALEIIWCFKIIYPDFVINQAELSGLWERGTKYINKRAEDNHWFQFAQTAMLLKIIFPERAPDLDYVEHWNKLLAAVDDFDLEENIGFKGFMNMNFYLAILAADEVKIDETGLHLINHPVPESLETEVPKQPAEKQI